MLSSMDLSHLTPPLSSTASPHPAALPSSPNPPIASDITTKLAALNLSTSSHSKNNTAVAKVTEDPDEDNDELPVSIANKFLGSTAAPNCLLTSHILRDLWSTVYWVWKHSKKTGERQVWRKFEELGEKLEDRHHTVLVNLERLHESEAQLWKEKLASSEKEVKAEKASSEKELKAEKASSEKELKAEKDLWKEKLASSEKELKAKKDALQAVKDALQAANKALSDATEAHSEAILAHQDLNMELREKAAQLKSVLLASKTAYSFIRGKSVSRACAWKIERVDSLLCPELVNTHALTEAEEGGVKILVEELMSQPENKEGTYYEFIEKGLRKFLPGCSVINTSRKYYLQGESPDISICVKGVRQAHRLSTHGIIEVKSQKENVDAAQWLGQVKDYLLDLLQSQPTRNDFWGFITNVNQIFLVECKRKDAQPGHRADTSYHLVKYGPLSWVQMIHYIRGVTSAPNMGCKPLPFSPTLGIAEELIGGSDKWRIGRFAIPEKPDSDMVVKVSLRDAGHVHIQELKILRYLKGCSSNVPKGICKLAWDPARDRGKNVYLFNDIDPTPRVQFGITPVGTTLSLDAFPNMEKFRQCISGLLDALQWLHCTARVIHRDVRVANVVLQRSVLTPVLIDFDCAIQLPPSSDTPLAAKITTYSGGLICVPPRVVEEAIKESVPITDVTYYPRIEDDYCALVLLVLELVFPTIYKKFPSRKAMSDGGRICLAALRGLHKNLAVNPTWGHLWDKARRGAISELQQLASVTLWIEET
ncbi:hypothetical protein BGX38DRAFT_1276382 [Terfezia claveryi]|nr:hypothetical protein BGX38DRAFT_1276382 [Terfezia claveryi]